MNRHTPATTKDPRPDCTLSDLCLNTLVAYRAFAEAPRHLRATAAGVIATIGTAVTFGVLAISYGVDQDYPPNESITLVKILGAALVMAGVGTAVAARRT